MARIVVGLALSIALAPFARAAGPASSCIACHGDRDLFEQRAAIVDEFRDDVHAAVGLGCQDCHGGNPDPALAEDLAAAMDEAFPEHPYRGRPPRISIPEFCGRCHSNAAYMKTFKPDLRVDQEQEYWTSQHGLRLRQGDVRVATCVDCHGTHGIRPVADARSRVHPLRVAQTCSGCHSDAVRMAGARRADGTALPVDQFAKWSRSVHAQALLERQDLSAPTCNDCHGNHGAVPPGIGSIAFVCGQCHGREAELFRASAKHQGFELHNELLAEAESCADCHDRAEPQAAIRGLQAFHECASCHGEHGIVRPTVAMLSPLPETPCAFCHEGSGPLADAVAEPGATAQHYRQLRDQLLEAAGARGLVEELRFDWLVDQAVQLPNHTIEGPGGGRQLRPEFERLFSKFRIGKVHHRVRDPANGRELTLTVVRCQDCHGIGDQTEGAKMAGLFLRRMNELTAATARAERMVLLARRGGVETRAALQEIDHAVDAQIELEVLVHSFTSGREGRFQVKHEEGMASAGKALRAAQAALGELQSRRRGLGVALCLILLVLIGLALKIRRLGGAIEA